ncbi:MAG: thioredoxin domain-containing protein, partial [Planctomycetota bacterium]
MLTPILRPIESCDSERFFIGAKMAAEYSKDTFETEVLKSEQPVMVDFWSDGCPPCKRLAPVIDALAESN